MTNADYKEKKMKLLRNKDESTIVVDHLTIRQSIFFLVLRLFAIEALAACFVVAFHFLLGEASSRMEVDTSVIFNLPVYLGLVVVKMFLTIFIVVQWVNEYYEIYPTEVIYKKGFIVKQEERYLVEHIGSMKIDQGFFGRVFNFGTIKLFNWTTEKDVLLYLIHNPLKYEHILEDLMPEADKGKEMFREHVIEEDQ
jgi:membrane protein YdbS with pleckstrin-like domain